MSGMLMQSHATSCNIMQSHTKSCNVHKVSRQVEWHTCSVIDILSSLWQCMHPYVFVRAEKGLVSGGLVSKAFYSWHKVVCTWKSHLCPCFSTIHTPTAYPTVWNGALAGGKGRVAPTCCYLPNPTSLSGGMALLGSAWPDRGVFVAATLAH